jgi:hypothetical protein
MSLAFAADDKATVVVDVEPKTLLVVDGKVSVRPPVSSCVITKVPYDPVAGAGEKLKVLFPPNVTPAFKPLVGFQEIVAASVKFCGADA